MNETNNLTLTHMEAGTLMAHETVSLLDTAETLNTAGICRVALEVFCTMQNLGEAGNALLTWVDMESAKPFTAEGKDSLHFIDSERLLEVPDAAAQMAVVWALFETAAMAGCGPDSRKALLDAAHAFTEMGGLEDMLLTIQQPAKALDAAALQEELADVCSAIQKAETADVGPCEETVSLDSPQPPEDTGTATDGGEKAV